MRSSLGVAVLVAAFLVVYLPDVGRGFIKDDFGWILNSRSQNLDQALALFATNVGFYRPLVSLSFAADYALWGLTPQGYGLTNLTLFSVCAALLFLLARQLGLPRAAAVLATAAWAFNFHGVNMALLWLSGRTAILATLFSLATALTLMRGMRMLAALLCFAGMLAKEEAVLLPALFTAVCFFDQQGVSVWIRARDALTRCWPLWISLVPYLVARQPSGAFGPLDAPSYYRFSFEPGLVLENAFAYADRAATVSAVTAIVLFLAVGRHRPRFVAAERRTFVLGAVWMAATYALTLFLPVRSSLYALLPSVGAALSAGAVASWAVREHPARFKKAATALVILVLLLVPVYRSRNVRWVTLAETSARVMRHIELDVAGRPNGGRIVLVDSPDEPLNLDGAFGTLLPEAIRLTVDRSWTGQLVTTTQEIPADASLVLRFVNGQLVPVW